MSIYLLLQYLLQFWPNKIYEYDIDIDNMSTLTSLFKKEHMGQFLLAILFIIYLIMGYKTPEPVANVIDTLPGKIVVIIVALALFANVHPILGVLGLLVAYDLIRRSSVATGMDALKKYLPTQEKVNSQFTAFNQFPYTLEQEVVKKMAPINHSNEFLGGSPATYKPIMDNIHDSAYIH